tara:strand:+ start:121 stop:606 length:486 start_codon:yes stop_codon:yes gene_type:complete
MQELIKKQWTSGSGKNFSFDEIVNILNLYVRNGAKIFIGTDSFIANKKVCFASALCLHGKNNSGRYFFIKENIPNKMYKNLSARITEEARRSVEIGCYLMDKHLFEPSNIELHLDISPFSAGNATSKFSDMLKGYVQGFGFNYQIKPNAWASQSIADKHSK